MILIVLCSLQGAMHTCTWHKQLFPHAQYFLKKSFSYQRLVKYGGARTEVTGHEVIGVKRILKIQHIFLVYFSMKISKCGFIKPGRLYHNALYVSHFVIGPHLLSASYTQTFCESGGHQRKLNFPIALYLSHLGFCS